MRIASFVLLGAALAFTGCNKKEEAAGGGESSTTAAKKKGPTTAQKQKAKLVQPGEKKAPAGQAAAPGSQPSSLPAGHPPVGGEQAAAPGSQPSSMPAGHPPVGGGGAAGGNVTGTISLAPALKDRAKPGAVLFIIARRDAGEGKKGMLLAAKKVDAKADDFPLKYTLTQADVMMQGTQLNGTVRISARLDQDGDAISKQPGDLTGAAATAHPVGTDGVDFTLDTSL